MMPSYTPFEYLDAVAGAALLGTTYFLVVRHVYRRLVGARSHKERAMSADNWVGLVGALAILAYLLYSLLHPERF